MGQSTPVLTCLQAGYKVMMALSLRLLRQVETWAGNREGRPSLTAGLCYNPATIRLDTRLPDPGNKLRINLGLCYTPNDPTPYIDTLLLLAT